MHAITWHRIVCPHAGIIVGGGHTMKSGPSEWGIQRSECGIQRRVREHNGQRRPPNVCPARLQGHKDESIFSSIPDLTLDPDYSDLMSAAYVLTLFQMKLFD